MADAVDQLLHGKGKYQEAIGAIIVVRVTVLVDHQDDRQLGFFWCSAWQMRFPLVRMEEASTTTRSGIEVSRCASEAAPLGTLSTRYPFFVNPAAKEG